MLSLNTNISDLILQRTLLESTVGLNEAINRMTTGLKVNHAKDNAAGFSIIEDLNTRISSMLQVQQNTEDGISLLSTAEGGLEEIQGLLERLRDLTIQASTDTYDAKTRSSMQAEADAILEEINRLKNTVQYDGMNLYETPSRNNSNNNSIANLAQAARVSMTTDTGDIISENAFTLNPVSLMNAGDDSSSSPASFSSGVNSEGVNNGVMLLSLDDGVAVASTGSDSGVITLAKNETTTIYVGAENAIAYTIKNTGSTTSELAYSKDANGVITFTGNYFRIEGQTDVSHNVIIDGSSCYFSGGNFADTISTTSSAKFAYIYGLGGDDEIVMNANTARTVSGGDGNDIITMNRGQDAYVEGGAGDDTFNLKGGGGTNTRVYGGSGEDVFNIENSNYTLLGEADNDTFNFLKTGLTTCVIDGGAGTNTVTGPVGSNVTANVEGANSYIVNIAGNSSVDLTINNISYNIANNATDERTLIYSINSSDQIEFKGLNNTAFVITGDKNSVHNVKLGQNMTFHGGDLADTIVSTSACVIYSYGGNDNITAGGGTVFAGEGDDIITTKTTGCDIRAEGGNDTITINSGYYNSIDTGTGDDIVNLTGSGNYNHGGNYNGFYNPEGNDTFNDSGNHINMISGFGSLDNAQAILVAAKSNKDIEINGATFNLKNNLTYDSVFLYSYDSITGKYSFFTEDYNNLITAQNGIKYDIALYGEMTFKSGNLDDTIDTYGTICVYGNDGDDTIASHSNNWGSIYGGNGNDTLISDNYLCRNAFVGGEGDDILIVEEGTTTSSGEGGNDTYYISSDRAGAVTDNLGNNIYYIEADGRTITSGTGDDTFYVSGSNNTVNGQGGNDYFEVTGTGNTLLGGSGHTTFVVDAPDNSISAGEPSDVIITVPESDCTILTPDKIEIVEVPVVNFTDSNEATKNINGLNYKFTNLSADSSNNVTYIINENTGLVTFTCSDVQIDCIDNSEYKFSLRGENNIVNGGSLADKITIEQGTNNRINGNAGNDIIINDSANNTIYGGANDDTITLNQTASYVDGEGGNDTINVKSNNNTDIYAGAGNDKLVVSGSNNIIDAQDGNNNINITGSGNTITAEDGNNKVVVAGNDNEVTLGNGENTFGISGDGNTVGSLHTVGNLNINGDENTVVLGNVVQAYSTGSDSAFNGNITVNGNDNVILQEAGNNTVTIKGSGNEYTSNSGEKDITAIGNGNSLNTSDGNDKITVKGDANTITTTGGNNTVSIAGNSNQIQGGTGIDTMKISGNMNTAMGGDGNDRFTLTSGSNNIIDGEGGDRNTMVNYSSGINHTNVVDVTPQGFQLDLKVGIGYDDNSIISTTIEFNPILLSVDLSSAENALASLASIDDCLKTVNEQLLNIGSIINRLEMVLDEQSIKLENMISSRSTLRDANLAEESSNFIKYQILQEASSTLMSSSRGLRYQNVIGLLQSLG